MTDQSCRYCLGYGVWPPFSPDASGCPYCRPQEEPAEPDPLEVARFAAEGNPHCPEESDRDDDRP